jgi:glycerol-3-phosphate dehydrogenase
MSSAATARLALKVADVLYDLAVIGAGINGAGIARDAALRGLSVVVFDRSDLCSGTSAWSSRLIHGGLRYLEFGEIPLVYESLHERRTLRRIAPHLVHPLSISIPIYAGARRGPWLIRAGMLAYDLLSWHKSLPRHEMLDRDEMLASTPGLESRELQAGARYHDAQVTYAERLVVENLLAAGAAGASIRTWHEVVDLAVSKSRVERLRWQNRVTGEGGSCRARMVVNAAGPWVDRVLERATPTAERLIGGTKGSHVVVGVFPGAPEGAFYIEAASDHRPLFVIPWNGQFLIGTTDLRYEGDPASVRPSEEEVSYLLRETNRVFPGAGLTGADIHYAYAGVRPLPFRSRGPESAITRKHIVKHNVAVAGNLLSIVGGKLTTYRSLAEETVDRVGGLLGRRLPACRTANTPLPGGHELSDAAERLGRSGLVSDAGVRRLLSIYGGRVRRLLALAGESGALAVPLDEERTTLAAEVALAFRQEYAVTLVDVVFRRIMIGLAPDQGRPLYGPVASVAAAECGWDESRKHSELDALIRYADSLRAVGAAASGD